MSWGRADTRRCILFWGASVTSLIFTLTAVLVPWVLQLRALDQAIESKRDQVTRYQRLVSTLPEVRDALARERETDNLEELSFNAETPALAGAQVQRALQEMLREANARPISAQILPVDAQHQPPRVSVRIQLQSDTAQLLELLLKLEQARPLLFVDQMSIRSSARPESSTQRRVRRRRSPADDAGDLTVRLDVYGYSTGPTG
jgi:general secretion pathway protein M